MHNVLIENNHVVGHSSYDTEYETEWILHNTLKRLVTLGIDDFRAFICDPVIEYLPR